MSFNDQTKDHTSQINELLNTEELLEMLMLGGKLSRLKSGFEKRAVQLDMLEQVVHSFNDDRIVVVEAGTGVGKSLAYLIPAFSWVLKNSERVVISTATINLQQQILEQDIPIVQELFADEGGQDLSIVVAKGRNQYLCLQRLAEHIDDKDLFIDKDLEAIQDWANKTKTGDLSDLGFLPNNSLWSRINADQDVCPDSRCKQSENCFLHHMRRRMNSARIIITNHHLLFADLSIRSAGFGPDATVILPAFQRLIIDEAHNIESTATSYFSEEFNRLYVQKFINRLLRNKRGGATGVLAYFRETSNVLFDDIEEHLQTIAANVRDLDADCLSLFNETSSIRLRAGDEQLLELLEQRLFPRFIALQQSLSNCVSVLNDEYLHLENSGNSSPRMAELRIIIRRLGGLSKMCSDFREFNNRTNLVYWIEKKRIESGEQLVHFTVAPIEVNELLQQVLFDVFPGILLTSATLAVNKSIAVWQRRVGLENNERLSFTCMDSPFDYPNRVLLGVPSDAPDPTEQGYSQWLQHFIVRSLDISNGHALILFTSYTMLKYVYDYCKPILATSGIRCIRQGDDNRSRLMSDFRDDSSSVLFATYSFWEGIDAPGDSLQLLIICRLPFRVPTEPLLVAQREAVLERGGNPFIELSLPEAVMKLKQGFGRLMRRKSDKGVVLITDNRIVNKFYGSFFIHSLPPARLMVESTERLYQEIERILYWDTGEGAR